MSINLSTMSRDELLQLKVDADQALRDLEVRTLQEARNAIEETAKKFGYTVAELTGGRQSKGKAAKATAPAKFANPENAAETWSGRGRQPAWYKAAIEAGKTAEDMSL